MVVVVVAGVAVFVVVVTVFMVFVVVGMLRRHCSLVGTVRVSARISRCASLAVLCVLPHTPCVVRQLCLDAPADAPLALLVLLFFKRYSAWPWDSKAIHFRAGWKPFVHSRPRTSREAAPAMTIEPPVHITGAC